MNPFHTFPAASDEHSDEDGERGNRHLGPLAALVVAVLAVTLLGPRLVSRFSGWLQHDGNAASISPLLQQTDASGASLVVAQIGLVVSNRVVVTTNPKAPGSGTVQFTSAAGALQLDLEQPTWVATARAVPVDGGLATQSLTYTATTITDTQSGSGTPVPVRAQNYVAAPEALWLIAV